MKRRTLRIFVILALLSIIGIVVTQLFWFKKAYENNVQEFDQNCNIALKEVVKDILKFNNRTNFPIDPVVKLKDNYYAVMVNDQINGIVLEHYLQTELKKFNIHQGFEFSIYDCANKKIVYGGYVEGEGKYLPNEQPNLPTFKTDNYYFTVYFPHITSTIVAQMTLWTYSTGILLLVVIFFSYSLFVILKQKRLSEIQRDFINNMAHEIRTPLSTITISAQTLKNPNIIENPQRLLNYSTIIMNEAIKLKNQVDRVLSIADFEHQLKLKIEPTPIHELIEKTASQFQIQENKTVNFTFHFDSKINLVNIDALHMANLISNFIDNSIKYSKEIVNIKISTELLQANKISIHFEDDGLGISKENQKRIFTKFYRVPTGDVHTIKGFGIGLNYVALIVKAHKGTLQVNSDLHKGCKFTINLAL